MRPIVFQMKTLQTVMKTSNPVYNRCQSAQVPRLVVALCVLPVNMSSQDDFVSSQGSNMDEEQMQAMEASAIPNSTSRATKHGVKKFDEWAAKRKIEVFFHAGQHLPNYKVTIHYASGQAGDRKKRKLAILDSDEDE